MYSYGILVNEWDGYFDKSPFKFLKLKRQSVKIKGYILSSLAYIVYKYWHNYGLKFSMQKLRKIILGKTGG